LTALRFPLFLGTVLIAAAGCANQPARTDNDVAAAASPAVASATTSTTSASTAASIQAMKTSVPPSLLVFAHDQGYTHVVIKGDQYSFCKTEDEIGELIPTRQCLDQTQLESLRVRVQQQQQDLTRRTAETTQVH
jgi:hypothetical protein